MKPIHLVPPAKKPSFPRFLLSDAKSNEIGEVDALKVDPKEFGFDLYIKHLAQCGWRPRRCVLYQAVSLTYCNGSVPWHSDPGFGKVAACLVHKKPNLGNVTQLITKHGPCDMELGDLIVFDSDHGHAWIGHGTSIFAMVAVAPIRKKSITPSTTQSPSGVSRS